jgi:exo-1,4-beta-D-glucosaminidase
VHVQYSYDDNSVAVVNSTYEAVAGAKVSARIYGVDAKERAAHEATVDLKADSSTKVLELPKVEGLPKTYFLRLQLSDAGGKLLSDNFYWLSTKADTLDWKKQQDTVYTPQAEFGDLTGLATLPQVKLEATAMPGNGATQVTVSNPTQAVAFMVHLRVTRGNGGEDMTPILWEDNYFSLLPGERRTVGAKFDAAGLGGKEAVVVLDGWNVDAVVLGTAAN